MKNEYTDFEKDILQEMGNIGTGNAVTSLSTMLSKRIEMSTPSIHMLNMKQIADRMGGPEVEVTSVVLTIGHDMAGVVVFLLEKAFAYEVLNLLIGKSDRNLGELDSLDMSALLEIGNIMAASYVNALADMTGMTIDVSPPSISIDMLASVLSVPFAMSEEMGAQSLFIEGNFRSEDNGIKSYLILMPTTESLERMLKKLGAS